MTRAENPAAFPMPAAEHSQGGHFEQYGMELRDYFAAAEFMDAPEEAHLTAMQDLRAALSALAKRGME